METIATVLLSISGTIILLLLGIIGYFLSRREDKMDTVIRSIQQTLDAVSKIVAVHDVEIDNMKSDITEIKDGKFVVKYQKR